MKWLLILFVIAWPGLTNAAGLNLSWDECGASGVSFKSFACNTNEGEDVLVASFLLDDELPDYVSFQAHIDIRTGDGTLVDWWYLNSPPPHDGLGCRGAAATALDVQFAGQTACVDPWAHLPDDSVFVGYLYERLPYSSAQNSIRLRMGGGLRPPTSAQADTLSPNVEYYLVRIRWQHDRTIGDEACSGCEQPACIVLNSAIVYSVDSVGREVLLTSPLDRNWVTWQTATLASCPLSTATHRSTWGQVKALYR